MKDKQKNAFFNELAMEADYTDPEYAKAIYIAMVRLLLKQLRAKGKFHLPDFGEFSIIDYKGKRMINPHTKEYVQVPDSKALRFVGDYKLKQYIKKMRN